MKYLRSYKINESKQISEMVDGLKDALTPLSDEKKVFILNQIQDGDLGIRISCKLDHYIDFDNGRGKLQITSWEKFKKSNLEIIEIGSLIKEAIDRCEFEIISENISTEEMWGDFYGHNDVEGVALVYYLKIKI